MQPTNFAQTCGIYDNKTFRRPTFYQHALHPLLVKPLPPRPQTPNTKRKRLNGIQGIQCLPANEIATNEIVDDVFDLQNRPMDINESALDSDSDLSDDEEKKKEEAWKNYVKVTDLVEETIKKTYYCRKCFEKFKSKFSSRKKKV